MQQPIVVGLSETLRGPTADAVAAASPRVRIAWVSPSGEPRDDLAAVEVLYRGGGLTLPALRRLLPALPRLRWLHSMFAGVDGDLATEIAERDVVLTRTRGVHGPPVSEWVLMVLLATTKQLPALVRAQQAGEWSPLDVPLTVGGLTLGIVGYGEIGRAVAARARGFGLRLVATSRRAAPAPELDALYGAGELPRLLAESDYVVLLTPLTPETRGLIGEAALRGMRPSAWLINVARGEVVQESALLRALDEGWIAGAALDVFAQEPLPADSRLWRMPNLLLTPHNSGVPPARLAAAGLGQFVENVGRYARGEPLQNLVDKEAGY